ncbi:type II inositol-3,4-bisphosphate 4-phosphatase, partial [Thraustotheca clavata]
MVETGTEARRSVERDVSFESDVVGDAFTSPSVQSIYSVAATSSSRPTLSSSFTDVETVSLNCSAFGKFRDQRFQTRPSSKMANFFRRRSLSKSHNSSQQPMTFTESDIHMAGYLSKRGSWRKNWKQRYFILRIDHPSLCYCESEQTLELVGQVPITPNTHVIDNCIGCQKAPFYFEVHTPRRILYLGASTLHEHRKWVRSIQETIELVRSREQGENYVTQSSVLRPSPDATTIDRPTAASIVSSSIAEHITLMRGESGEGDVGRYDLRLELIVDEDNYSAGFYVLVEGLDAKAEWGILGQTDIFRCSDEDPVEHQTYRHAFSVLFELRTDLVTELRFSLYRATCTNEDISFGKTPIAIGQVEIQNFLPYALISCGGFDIDLTSAKILRSSFSQSRRNLLSQSISSLRGSVQKSITCDEEGQMYLHVTAFTHDSSISLGTPLTSHIVAHQKYVVPTAISSFGLVVDETLSVPSVTFGIPIAFVRFILDELEVRLKKLRAAPDKSLLHTTYSAMATEYKDILNFLTTTSGTAKAFRKSTFKKLHDWQMVATNLHMQSMQVHNGLEL